MKESKKAREKLLEQLPLCKIKEGGKLFETGTPVHFNYFHNTEKSPRMGSRFGQDIEPSGRYLSHDPKPGRPQPNWERGKTTFHNPLVMQLVTDRDTGIYGPTGWKAQLHRASKRKGKSLACHLRKLGFDSIVTCEEHRGSRYTSEMVDLRPVKCGR